MRLSKLVSLDFRKPTELTGSAAEVRAHCGGGAGTLWRSWLYVLQAASGIQSSPMLA